jgi:spermidine synthase
VKLSGNVGRSVGMLYFVNTLGSAVACFAAALVTMRYLGMSGSIYVAVALNALVAIIVLALHFHWRGKIAAPEVLEISEPVAQPALSFGVALALSGIAGFISLCYEIVWYRLYSYVSGGPSASFSFVLGAFLFGIAFGSLLTRKLCVGTASDLPRFTRSIALLVLLANLLGFAIVPLVARLVIHVSYLWTLPLIAIAAGLLGATFPLMCHISVRADSRAGAGLSYLYIGNIIGSAAGSWLVGFILMDYFSLRAISVMLAILGVGVASALYASGLRSIRGRVLSVAVTVGICAAVIVSAEPMFADVYGRMQFKKEWGEAGTRIVMLVENRSGVITVSDTDEIYGGGIYDGMLVTDVKKSDSVERPLSVSYIHPNPKEILIVGVSGGAWTEILANHPQVEKIVAIEINPGYFDVIRQYPAVAPLLTNPKVELVVDDGRRWMLHNGDRKFDMIVMDTIFNWRSHATNLLSIEYFDIARAHLKPGGVIYYNSTYSAVSQHTAAVHFPYAFRFGLFLAVSDSPIQLDRERWRNILLKYKIEGKTIYDPTNASDLKFLAEILKYCDTLPGDRYNEEGMETRDNILRRTAGLPIITDDNMATEWRSTLNHDVYGGTLKY